MATDTAFPDRAGRLARICGPAPLDQDFPLLKSLSLDAPLYRRLKAAVNLYLYVTLDRYCALRELIPKTRLGGVIFVSRCRSAYFTKCDLVVTL